MRYILVAMSFVVTFMLSTQYSQAQSVEKAIKARQAIMQLYSFNLGSLAAMVKGEADYDAEKAKAFAADLAAAANMSNTDMWPQGSDSSNAALKTRAKPEIWSTYPAIAEKSKAMKAGAEALAKVAGNGLDALKGALGGAGGGCKGCHETYRAPKPKS